METAETKKVVEALLFSASDPVPLSKLREIASPEAPLTTKEMRALLEELKSEYQERAFDLEEIGGGYLLRTRASYGEYVHLLQSKRRPSRLSQSAAEVLAIIAYRQPITRPAIEAIRGVDCSGQVHALVERELIESKGKLEVPGRPTLYGTTVKFLKQFGLKSCDELQKKNLEK